MRSVPSFISIGLLAVWKACQAPALIWVVIAGTSAAGDMGWNDYHSCSVSAHQVQWGERGHQHQWEGHAAVCGLAAGATRGRHCRGSQRPNWSDHTSPVCCHSEGKQVALEIMDWMFVGFKCTVLLLVVYWCYLCPTFRLPTWSQKTMTLRSHLVTMNGPLPNPPQTFPSQLEENTFCVQLSSAQHPGRDLPHRECTACCQQTSNLLVLSHPIPHSSSNRPLPNFGMTSVAVKLIEIHAVVFQYLP